MLTLNFLLDSSLIQVFKASVDPKHINIESLNQQAAELTKDSSPEQAVVLKEPLAQLNTRWGVLVNNIGDRQVIWVVAVVVVSRSHTVLQTVLLSFFHSNLETH